MNKYAAGPLQSLLFGLGHKSIPAAERLLHSNGHFDRLLFNADRLGLNRFIPRPQLTDLVENAVKQTPMHLRGLRQAKTLLVGDKPVEVLRQRMQQGGLLGKGGILRSYVALSPELSSGIKEHGVLGGIAKNPGPALGDALNLTLGVGAPVITAYNAYNRGDTEGVARSLGEGLGWSMASPFGVLVAPRIAGAAGELASMAIRHPSTEYMEQVPQEAFEYQNQFNKQGSLTLLLPRIKLN